MILGVENGVWVGIDIERKQGQSSVGFGDSSFIEELMEGFAQDRQSTGHGLFCACECCAEIVNPLSVCQGWESKLSGRES